MHIDVTDILQGETGERRSYRIDGEHPDFEDVQLADNLAGTVTVVKSDEGLEVAGKLKATITLECHRCLRAFQTSFALSLFGEFVDQPKEEEWPIERPAKIDIAPLVRQEIILNVPIKQLCSQDCLGLCEVCGIPMDSEHKH